MKNYQKLLAEIHKFDDEIVDHMYDAIVRLAKVFDDHEYRHDLEREKGRVVNELMLYDDLDERIPGLTALGYGFSTLNLMYQHFPKRESWTGANAATLLEEARTAHAAVPPEDEEEKPKQNRATLAEIRRYAERLAESKDDCKRLQEANDELHRRIGELEQLVKQLQAENEELRQRLTETRSVTAGT